MKQALALAALVAFLRGVALADGPQTGTVDGLAVDAQGSALSGVTVSLTSNRGEAGMVNTRREEGRSTSDRPL